MEGEGRISEGGADVATTTATVLATRVCIPIKQSDMTRGYGKEGNRRKELLRKLNGAVLNYDRILAASTRPLSARWLVAVGRHSAPLGCVILLSACPRRSRVSRACLPKLNASDDSEIVVVLQLTTGKLFTTSRACWN